MCCHNKTWSLCCMQTNSSKHWNQTLFIVNRCSQKARNHLARATINQIEAAWNLPILFTRATLAMWVHPGTIKLLDLWVRSFSSSNYRYHDWGGSLTKAGEGGKSGFSEALYCHFGRGAWARAAAQGWVERGFYKIWQSVSQCGALSRVKYLDVLPSNSKKWMFSVLGGFLTSSGMPPRFPFR